MKKFFLTIIVVTLLVVAGATLWILYPEMTEGENAIPRTLGFVSIALGGLFTTVSIISWWSSRQKRNLHKEVDAYTWDPKTQGWMGVHIP
ncbi:MAG: hypothetical protein ABIJ23_01420 [Candidatus Magasanikbacteria bacterium]